MSHQRQDDQIEAGNLDTPKSRQGMDPGDRVALITIAIIMGVLSIGLMLALRWVLVTVFGAFATLDSGIGLRYAFLIATGLSITTMIGFALVAGDGVVGELPVMLVGFFLMLIFYTVSIAVIF